MKSSIRVYLRLPDSPYQEVHFDTDKEGDIALKSAINFWETSGHAATKIVGKKRTLVVPADVVACVLLYKYNEAPVITTNTKTEINKRELLKTVKAAKAAKKIRGGVKITARKSK